MKMYLMFLFTDAHTTMKIMSNILKPCGIATVSLEEIMQQVM